MSNWCKKLTMYPVAQKRQLAEPVSRVDLGHRATYPNTTTRVWVLQKYLHTSVHCENRFSRSTEKKQSETATPANTRHNQMAKGKYKSITNRNQEDMDQKIVALKKRKHEARGASRWPAGRSQHVPVNPAGPSRGHQVPALGSEQPGPQH